MADHPASTEALLAHPDLWRAGRIEPNAQTISTGYPTLDSLLADRGWPKAGLMELLSAQSGIGELRLLGPALSELSAKERRWITWINPPHIPYAPALAEIGIDIGKVLLVHPKTHEDALWALEQAVKSGSCSAALAWLDDSKLAAKDVRRLKLAARRGESLTVLFRPSTAAQRQSMAELRILMQPAAADRLSIEILKRRGGWPIEKLALELAYRTTRMSRRDLREQLTLWRARSLRSIALLPTTRPSSTQSTHAGGP
jgi:cell division inhibitor SulA/protein ImuA